MPRPTPERLRGCLPGCAALPLLWLLGLVALVRELIRILRRRPHALEVFAERDRARPLRGCRRIPASVYRRPDPLLYAQYHLMDQGLAVTWDNPDIHLERNGAAVPSAAIAPDTEHEIVARVWNGSMEAPAVDLPVRFSYLDFGIGTVSVPIGERRVDLPVNGAAGHPAIVRIPWRTPAAPGHYCLQVELLWGDDANPANNLGQENLTVGALNSPRAAFTFPVRNPDRRTRTLRLEVDAYAIPPRRRCPPAPAERPPTVAEEAAAHRRDALARHGRGGFPVPEGWRVAVEPAELRLGGGEARQVTVDVTAPDAFLGRQTFNVAAFDGQRLVGGVTLAVDGSGE